MEKDRINTEGRTLSQSIGNRPAEEKTVFRLMEPIVSAAARLHQAGGSYGNRGPASIAIRCPFTAPVRRNGKRARTGQRQRRLLFLCYTGIVRKMTARCSVYRWRSTWAGRCPAHGQTYTAYAR